jgi:hypothetical protein
MILTESVNRWRGDRGGIEAQFGRRSDGLGKEQNNMKRRQHRNVGEQKKIYNPTLKRDTHPSVAVGAPVIW